MAETIGKKVSLYLDNQAVIKVIKSHNAHLGQYLLQHISVSINRLNTNLTIHWISSHSNVKGNEKVDWLAKEAAEGRSSVAITLPQLLRSPLPTSASATKQKYNTTLLNIWKSITQTNQNHAIWGIIPIQKVHQIIITLIQKAFEHHPPALLWPLPA